MRPLIFFLMLWPALAFAQPSANSFRFNQYDAGVPGFFARDIAVPGGGGSGILVYDLATQRPKLVDIGSGLSYAAGALSVSSGSVAWASITGTPTTLSGYSISDAQPLDADLTAIAALTTTSFGRSVLTQADAAAIRSLIGAGTGNGTVTSVAAGTGLSGGTITTTGTISLPNTGTAGTYSGVTTDAQGRVTAGTTMSISDTPGRSLVTTTSSTGFQISSTRNARACYEGSISTTSTIGGPAAASIFLETADTNSTTPGDWTTKAQQTYSNTITLAIVLNQVQVSNWGFCRDIPAGKFVRVRSGSITGTASATINSAQQETLM